MPELPEVQAITDQLNSLLKNHKIEKVKICSNNIFEGDENLLINKKFLNAQRFGKVIVCNFNDNVSFIAHVKLTGQFIYQGPNLKNNNLQLSKKIVGGLGGKHTHVIFYLDKGGVLYYNDHRKFGWIKLVSTDKVLDFEFIKKLGPEPFGKLDLKTFENIINSSKKNIKVLIMDQNKIGGIGNIYANDALFLAKINPKRNANTLSSEEIEKLFDAILFVLKKGIQAGGASELSFVRPDGTEGTYQKHTLVYGKQNKQCANCGEKILKISIGGRGTFYCTNCQK